MIKNKAQYHHGDLRKSLIATAIEIIIEEGLEKISMRRLGRRIGVSRTAAYRHFAGKSDLLCSIAEEGFIKMKKKIRQAHSETNDHVAKLMQQGVAYIEFAIKNPVYYRLMFGNILKIQDRTPDLIAAAAAAYKEIVDCVIECQKKKHVKPYDPHMIANMCWAMTHGISMLIIDRHVQSTNAFHDVPALLMENDDKKAIDLQKIAGYVNTTLFEGILTKNDRPGGPTKVIS